MFVWVFCLFCLLFRFLVIDFYLFVVVGCVVVVVFVFFVVFFLFF